MVRYHKQNILPHNGIFAEEDVKRLREYRFNYLRGSIQSLIIDKLNELISLEGFFAFDSNDFDFKYKALHTILLLDDRFTNLMQKFDFARDIPKLVIFDGDERVFNENDAIVIGFLHLVGFDIIILTPTGYQNLEHLILPYYYDNHKRDRFEMGLTVPRENVVRREEKKSWWERLLF